MSTSDILYNGQASLVGHSQPQSNPLFAFQQIVSPAASVNTALVYPYSVFSSATTLGAMSCTLSGLMIKTPGQFMTIRNSMNTGLQVNLNSGTFLISSSVTSSGSHVLAANTSQQYLLGTTQMIVL